MFSFLILVTSNANISASPSEIVPRSDATSTAQQDLDNYVSGICDPNGSSTRPCEAVAAINYQCITGLDYDAVDIRGPNYPSCYDTATCQSDEFQRTCFCQSQFVDSTIGCLDCYILHGGADSTPMTSINMSAIEPVMDEYCNPMVDPTTNFNDYIASIYTDPEYTSTLTKWSDPLGFSKTDVSLYYTPSMTGIEAWTTTLSTIADWSEDAVTPTGSATSTSFSSDSEYTPRATTFSSTSDSDNTSSDTLTLKSRKSLASTTTIDSLNTSGAGPTPYPPIFIQPVYPTTSTRVVPLPSLVTDDSAAHTLRISVGCVVGVFGLVAILLIL
jgi:hypothetical protein